jgi:hypothetical protein
MMEVKGEFIAYFLMKIKPRELKKFESRDRFSKFNYPVGLGPTSML